MRIAAFVFAAALSCIPRLVLGGGLNEELERLPSSDRLWIENSCASAHQIGPAEFVDCIERQLSAIRKLKGSEYAGEQKPSGSKSIDAPKPPRLNLRADGTVKLGDSDAYRKPNSDRKVSDSQAGQGAVECSDGAQLVTREAARLLAKVGQATQQGSMLPVGTHVVIVEEESNNGHCKVVVTSSGRSGWLQRRLLSIRPDSSVVRRTDAFQRTETGDSGPPRVAVENLAGRSITLAIGGEEYQIATGSTHSIVLTAGSYKYYATAAGVRPLLGQQSFLNGSKYAWTFYIRSSKRP